MYLHKLQKDHHYQLLPYQLLGILSCKEIDQFKKTTEWRTIGVRIRNTEISLLNRQLDRLSYTTLG